MRGSGKQSRHAGLRYYGQTNRRGRPRQIGRKWQIGQNEPRGRPRHARSQSLLPLGSIRLLAFRLKILLYFSCCLQGSLFLRSLRLCPFSAFEKTNPSQEPRSERTRGAKLTRQPGYFGRTNPRRQPGQHLAKRSQGAARSRLWPNKAKGHRVTISAKRTQAADQSASSPNEPDEQPSRSCFRQKNPGCSPVPI